MKDFQNLLTISKNSEQKIAGVVADLKDFFTCLHASLLLLLRYIAVSRKFFIIMRIF